MNTSSHHLQLKTIHSNITTEKLNETIHQTTKIGNTPHCDIVCLKNSTLGNIELTFELEFGVYYRVKCNHKNNILAVNMVKSGNFLLGNNDIIIISDLSTINEGACIIPEHSICSKINIHSFNNYYRQKEYLIMQVNLIKSKSSHTFSPSISPLNSWDTIVYPTVIQKPPSVVLNQPSQPISPSTTTSFSHPPPMNCFGLTNKHWSNQIYESFEQYIQCAICLGSFIDPHMTACGHNFCHDCIFSHIQVNNKCPLCRVDIHIAPTPNLLLNNLILECKSLEQSNGDCSNDYFKLLQEYKTNQTEQLKELSQLIEVAKKHGIIFLRIGEDWGRDLQLHVQEHLQSLQGHSRRIYLELIGLTKEFMQTANPQQMKNAIINLGLQACKSNNVDTVDVALLKKYSSGFFTFQHKNNGNIV